MKNWIKFKTIFAVDSFLLISKFNRWSRRRDDTFPNFNWEEIVANINLMLKIN